jgi:hypothetical protein
VHFERLAEQFRGRPKLIQEISTVTARGQMICHVNSIAWIQFFVNPSLQLSI